VDHKVHLPDDVVTVAAEHIDALTDFHHHIRIKDSERPADTRHFHVLLKEKDKP
jgi:hypothetical protein